MKLFEVFVVEGRDTSNLLSAEVIEATGAAVMTPEEAAFVGLEGIPEDPEGRKRLLIAFNPTGERLIASRLEAHDAVASFKLHMLG